MAIKEKQKRAYNFFITGEWLKQIDDGEVPLDTDLYEDSQETILEALVDIEDDIDCVMNNIKTVQEIKENARKPLENISNKWL